MITAPMINRSSLSEQAYVAIKGMIHRLELKPGEPITEAQLSALLNISKSPIRSALIHLQRDGLLTMTPYKETIVSELSVDVVRSLYEARALI
ncbi:MAG: GntR family transcriptional regulator, partial [Geminicoccales bacterium]